MSRNRRDFLTLSSKAAGTAAVLSALPPSIARALAIEPTRATGTIADVAHVVIMMQENRSFDHYFGTLKGVRGFGDRHPVPLASGKTVWHQSDGAREIPPYHLDSATTSALRVPSTPHAFDNAQAAWGQGRFGFWPKYKHGYSMGYYARADIPFQFALAEAFTICDAYHCSVTSGTDPNRVVFFSGSSFDPKQRAKGINCTDAESEPNNLRCWIKGALPEPGYTYAGSAFDWPTIPDVLDHADISWRIYQDPNNNFTGAMHGGLAFRSFRTAKAGSSLYEKGMRDWSLDQFADDVRTGALPRVSWILPPQMWSEHPDGSTPVQGAVFTARVLDALTANPDVWSKTVLFLTFDENDGYFDHAPPPAPPSYNADGTLAGAATLDLSGMYFSDPNGAYRKPDDTISGAVRPWGLGARVPAYVISPWSKGGWVCSQVFDHTSVGQFLEKRFGVVIPAISPWHRAVCGDLTSALDFATPGTDVPPLPSTKDASDILLAQDQKPSPEPPATATLPAQEPGARPSRALPYALHADAEQKDNGLALTFSNTGRAGAVFHVYDRNALDRIPRRYTVEAGKTLKDTVPAGSAVAVSIYGPNGFLREYTSQGASGLRVDVRYDAALRAVIVTARNATAMAQTVALRENAYGPAVRATITLKAGAEARHVVDVVASANWYDFTAAAGTSHWRFAGRLETGGPSTSDPETAAL